MFRRVVACLGVCSAMALASIGVGGVTGDIPHAWADDNQATPEELIDALGGASGMTATRREVARGDTLLDVLINAGSKVDEADRAIVAMTSLFSPERLQIGQVVTAIFDTQTGSDGPHLAAVSLTVDNNRFVVANRTVDGSYVASVSDVALDQLLITPQPAEEFTGRKIPTVSRLEVRRGDTLIRLVMRGGADRADAEAAISEPAREVRSYQAPSRPVP